jgi:hypothetical protein
MKPENFDIEELKCNLLDTAKTLNEATLEMYNTDSSILTKEDYASINDDLFCCIECYHWCEKSDESEENNRTCIDCAE